VQIPKNMAKRKKKLVRKAGEETWVDETLETWPENDFRIFCGNMGNEVNDDVLSNAFKKYPSFFKARVVRDRRTLKSKGFGFVSLTSVDDYIKAMREMQGKYVGNRPITMRRSDWKDKSAFNR
jgi:RNA recognition motif-containing protein